jgi:hypothetical protein
MLVKLRRSRCPASWAICQRLTSSRLREIVPGPSPTGTPARPDSLISHLCAILTAIGLRDIHVLPSRASSEIPPCWNERSPLRGDRSIPPSPALTLLSRKANHPTRFDATVRLNKGADRTGAMRERRTRRANDCAEL